MEQRGKSLSEILGVSVAKKLQETVLAKSLSPSLDRLADGARVMRFMRVNLCGSYTFARFAVPSYAAALFASLTVFQPLDDRLGRLVFGLLEVVRGELCTNNIFTRQEERHAHFHDALEAYEAAGGDMEEVTTFFTNEQLVGFEQAILHSHLWGTGSVLFARAVLDCCADPLALFILMPVNEDLAPRLYERALHSLSTELRFAKFRQFLERHVSLDQDEHGPVTLEWLACYLQKFKPSRDKIRESTQKVLNLYAPRIITVRA